MLSDKSSAFIRLHVECLVCVNALVETSIDENLHLLSRQLFMKLNTLCQVLMQLLLPMQEPQDLWEWQLFKLTTAGGRPLAVTYP